MQRPRILRDGQNTSFADPLVELRPQKPVPNFRGAVVAFDSFSVRLGERESAWRAEHVDNAGSCEYEAHAGFGRGFRCLKKGREEEFS